VHKLGHDQARQSNNAALFRPLFDGPLLSAAAYTPESAAEAASVSSYGKLRLAHA
jgi:hypothetical protein